MIHLPLLIAYNLYFFFVLHPASEKYRLVSCQKFQDNWFILWNSPKYNSSENKNSLLLWNSPSSWLNPKLDFISSLPILLAFGLFLSDSLPLFFKKSISLYCLACGILFPNQVLRDVSSPTRNWTHISSIGNMES